VPSKRGHGIGDALLTRLIETAATAGHPALSLSVDSENAGAIRLYEKHGFVRSADDGASLTMVATIS
jgi:ribosomal protein S18 acetylase RimI-like enzyme